MKWRLSGLLWMVGLTCGVACLASQDEAVLHVMVYTDLHPDIVARAESDAASILRRAGVRSTWQNCSASEACTPSPDLPDISLNIMKQLRVESLGCSFVTTRGGSLAEIGFENAHRLANATLIPIDQVLGAVIAHEIGHLLLGPAHATCGLMHAYWNTKELCLLSQGLLLFDFDECPRLRNAVLNIPVAEKSAKNALHSLEAK